MFLKIFSDTKILKHCQMFIAVDNIENELKTGILHELLNILDTIIELYEE